MSFNIVYGRRREQFQWFDVHVLKAVAVQHSYKIEPFSVRPDEIIPPERVWASPAIHITNVRNVRVIPITTPSPPEKVALEQKSVDQKQPIKIASEGPLVPGPSSTRDTFIYGGDLASSKMSNHSPKGEDANAKVEKPGAGTVCKSSTSLDNRQKSGAGAAMSRNTTVHQFVGGRAFPNPPIERAKRQVPFLSTDSVSPNKPGAFCPEISRPLHAPVAKASDLQTDQYVTNHVRDLVKDVGSDKTNLISATESVLNILKVVEAKKQEASRAKAAAPDGPDDILDKVESSRMHWIELAKTNWKLAGDVKENKSCLAAEAVYIKACLLILLKDKDKSLVVLDDMRRALEPQLAEVVDDIEKAKLIKLEKEEAQKVLLDKELAVKKITEEAELLKLEDEENSKLRQLFEDYRYEVDILREDMECICQNIRSLMEKFDQRIPIRESATSCKKRVVLGSSISSHESEDSIQSETYKPLVPTVLSLNRSASHSSVSSQESEDWTESESSEESYESEFSQASSLAGSDMESAISVQESEDSESGLSRRFASRSQSLKRSASYVSFSSEESDVFALAKASDVEASAVTPQKIAVCTQADPSEAVSFQNTALSTEAGHHELPHETCPAIPTDEANIGEALNANNDAKTLSDDDWDLCGHSDSDA